MKEDKSFVDSTVKRGQLKPDGSTEWVGVMDAFPKGWDDPGKFRVRIADKVKRADKEEEAMARHWTCVFCGFLNMSKHEVCERCGAPRKGKK